MSQFAFVAVALFVAGPVAIVGGVSRHAVIAWREGDKRGAASLAVTAALTVASFATAWGFYRA